MKNLAKFFYLPLIILSLGILSLSSFKGDKSSKISFPYKKAGLTEREAASHLLSRFTYGIKPGDVDKVVNEGLEKWLQKQLKADFKDESLNEMLKDYKALKLSNGEVTNLYLNGGEVIRMAVKEGFIDKDSINKSDKSLYREKVKAYMLEKGLRPPQELYREFINQKILRATYTENQLQEVMTDFWFNHFNVSFTNNKCSIYIPAYERDVIRPNVFGKFENLVLATAKSPAMLYYLDNFSSVSTNASMYNKGQNKSRGLNENYAREVMELHTLGVDGGYKQQDVTQAAKILTGWTVAPMNENMLKAYGGKLDMEKMAKNGFVKDGDFIFNINRHDKGEKVVLGKRFGPNGGYDEGVELLEMLANHQSTAAFISKKIAIRFVNDQPSKTLINEMAKTYTATKGDINKVLITMVNSPEFWSKEALREKTKSPFELAISAVRSLDATISQPSQINNWVTKMGQKLYFYQAPTGYPDKAQYWINTGALLNRMNFGLALASQKIPGVKINLAALNNNHEPESSKAALEIYGKIMMPERDLNETISRLSPMLNDPDLVEKVDQAASKANTQSIMNESNSTMMMSEEEPVAAKEIKKPIMQTAKGSNGSASMLAQVVGVIIGSPEFQKR